MGCTSSIANRTKEATADTTQGKQDAAVDSVEKEAAAIEADDLTQQQHEAKQEKQADAINSAKKEAGDIDAAKEPKTDGEKMTKDEKDEEETRFDANTEENVTEKQDAEESCEIQDEGGSDESQDLDVGYPGQLSCYMALYTNIILNHGRTNGEQSVEQQWPAVSKVDALSYEYVPPSLTQKAGGSHLTMGITIEGAMRFVQRIGFPKRYKRNEETLGWVTQAYGTKLTGYDFAHAVRAWLDENGHADKSVCEALAQEGDEDVGPAHTFLSHVQSQSLDATLRAMIVAPYLTGGLGKHKACSGFAGGSDSEKEEEQEGGSGASEVREDKFIANKLEVEGSRRVYVHIRAPRAEDEPFAVYVPQAFAEAAEGLGKKLLWNKVGAVIPTGEFVAWPGSGDEEEEGAEQQSSAFESFSEKLSSDNKALWLVNGVVVDGKYHSVLDEYGGYEHNGSVFGGNGVTNGTGFTLVFERQASPRFWLDYFCLRQQVADFNLDQILDAIGEIGSMVVDFDPSPTNYLSRSFCVFESFAACQRKCELLCFVGSNIFGDTATMAQTAHRIMTETSRVEVDCKAAQTRFEEDRAKISAYIDTIGEKVVNHTVKAAMNSGSKICHDIFDEIDH